ncbi:cysteine desulfurase family protein [Bacillus suaedae]|uniref:IscS subfamily cysteine desulfurase n=1 Tax=Halalkalibacter suaedae TaxID=2822140 RepID=A0A940WVL5_9BACI|nr:IscS subfamily cysteine desulfurase [Bacillus suaedae]MBP3951422.1 IscS subfamily cysteine desulfurase [Bacillus suaedae]
MIYLDYSATTPMSPVAIETYTHVASEYFANSRSIHTNGQESEDVLELSRHTIAQALNCNKHEVYFTGSGSEATFLALVGLALAHSEKGKTIITTKGEHHSVHQALAYLRDHHDFTILYVPVNEFGEVTVASLLSTLTADTILVSIGHANSEIGTVQDIRAIGQVLMEKNILFHCDCVQSFTKLPIPIDFLTSVTVSAHKCYGPKGVGAAFIRNQVAWHPFLHGTTHERGFRAGTVDVPAIASFAAATEESSSQKDAEMTRLQSLRQQFVNAFSGEDRLVLEGHPINRLPFHLAIRVKGIEGQLMMLECSRRGFSISTGTACRVGDTNPSSTLLSLGRTKEQAYELIRITFGRWTTNEDVDKLIKCIRDIMAVY